MHEEPVGDERSSEEPEATGVEQEDGAAPSVRKESSDDETPTESPWVPGVVEVEFKAGVVPDITADPVSGHNKIQSLAGRDLSGLNQQLAELGLDRAGLTFRGPRDEADKLQGVALQQGIEVPSLSSFVTLYFPPEIDVEQVARELARFDEVAHAWPVPRSQPPVTVSVDPLLGNSDQLPRMPHDPCDLDTQWYIFRCRADRAWQLGYTGRGVVLADIDWGYQVTHPELVRRLDPREHCHNSVDGSSKVDFAQNTDHGTAVLGLAGAGADGSGMIGFAHAAELWAIQANAGDGPTNGVTEWVEAFRWVMAKESGKRKIILLEREAVGGINIEMERTQNVTIRTAIANGIVVCVTAGNGSRDADLGLGGMPIEPTGSILIGATTYNPDRNERHSASNWGPRVVVSAPGDDEHDVTCSIEAGKPFTNEFGGTSGAAPKVAGAVALMLEANPYIRHSDVRQILNRTGTHIVTCDDKPVGRFLDCEAAVLAARCAPAWGTAWEKLSGTALDLVFAPDGTAWHVGLDHVVYRRNGDDSDWLAHSPTIDGVKLAVGACGNPWYVAVGGEIFRWVGGLWQQLPGQALDIGVGANGSVWHVGTDHCIYRWLNASWEALSIYGSAVKIAVETDGSPWYISSLTGDIYRKVGETWQQVPGQALDLSIGADGSVWRIGLNVTGDGNLMSRWSGSDWEPMDGAAAAIAVGPNGLPWHINRSGDIFRRI